MEVLMEPEQVLNNLKRAISRRVEALAISVTSGGVDNMETYTSHDHRLKEKKIRFQEIKKTTDLQSLEQA